VCVCVCVCVCARALSLREKKSEWVGAQSVVGACTGSGGHRGARGAWAGIGESARVELKGLYPCGARPDRQRENRQRELRIGSALALAPFLAGTLNAGCEPDYRRPHVVPEQWERSNFELLPHGQSLCTLRTGSARALALFQQIVYIRVLSVCCLVSLVLSCYRPLYDFWILRARIGSAVTGEYGTFLNHFSNDYFPLEILGFRENDYSLLFQPRCRCRVWLPRCLAGGVDGVVSAPWSFDAGQPWRVTVTAAAAAAAAAAVSPSVVSARVYLGTEDVDVPCLGGLDKSSLLNICRSDVHHHSYELGSRY